MSNTIQYVAKTKYPLHMMGYRNWTEVSQFLATGLLGVSIKRKLKLRDL